MVITALQIAAVMLFLGHGRGAINIFLIAMGMLALSPWFWAAIFGVAAATKDDT